MDKIRLAAIASLNKTMLQLENKKAEEELSAQDEFMLESSKYSLLTSIEYLLEVIEELQS